MTMAGRPLPLLPTGSKAVSCVRSPLGCGTVEGRCNKALLAGVQETGSLAQAARGVGQSYRHAWGLVKGAEAL